MFSRLRFLPTVYEMVGFVFLSLLLMIAANSKQLLNYYGLNSSSQLVHDSLGTALGTGLSKIDGFSFTANAVTFIVWAVIGLVCFSIVRGIGRVFGELEFDNQLSSNRYVHPSTFRRASFWSRVLVDFLLTSFALVFLGCMIFLFVSVLLPIAVAYGQQFLLQVSFSHIGEFIVGAAVLYLGIVMVDVAVRFLIFHGRLVASRPHER